MIKMIKQTDEDTFYWEIWEEEEDQELLEHFGIVGDQGESRRFVLPAGEDAEVWKEEIAEEKESEGYDYLDEEELHELVIQYSYEEDQIEDALERRHAVEELMSECLGWTGNGHFDGGDIGSGTASSGGGAKNHQYDATVIRIVTRTSPKVAAMKGVTGRDRPLTFLSADAELDMYRR